MASPAEETCSAASALAHPPALLDYAAIHSCLLRGDARLSLPLLALLLTIHFRLLAAAAVAHFTPAVSRLAAPLRLTPSMAAVTLLALGHGAPDAFASAAALGGPGGMPCAGLAVILSAGTFVSAFVVGAVALIAAPFAVPPASFAQDVFCYLVAASGLFYIYLSAEIFFLAGRRACALLCLLRGASVLHGFGCRGEGGERRQAGDGEWHWPCGDGLASHSGGS